MLLRFHTSNFRSLRAEQTLSLVASLPADSTQSVAVEALGVDVLRVAAVYGANAAGKSNLFWALQFMQRAVLESHRWWRPEGPIPAQPFLLDETQRAAPSRFEMDFLIDGVPYSYGFQLDVERILEEWLYAYPKARRQTLFRRVAGEASPFMFGKHLRGANRSIAALTRGNSLFLSVAAENNHPDLAEIYRWFAEGWLFSDSTSRTEDLGCTLDQILRVNAKESVLRLLRMADLGIEDLEVRGEWNRHSPEPWRRDEVHERLAPELDVTFRHLARGASVPLTLAEESRGTRMWFALAGPLLSVLARGGILCVDELDASLHPHLAGELVQIFQSSQTNPQNAQLIFNTHDPTLLGNLLSAPGLRRDQVWFVEKDRSGATQLYPLTDFKPRKDENLERGYLQGRYGAVPFLESFAGGEEHAG